jgi:hypothetical protein
MVDATPDGEHMLLETFGHVVEFMERLKDPVYMITGGEPTKHPFLLPLLHMVPVSSVVILMTNGEFFEQWEEEDVQKLGAYLYGIQITNDPRYYPRKVEDPHIEGVTFEDHIRGLSPCKKVTDNGLEVTRQFPECFNMRSLTTHFRDMSQAQSLLIRQGKFCSPSINIDGSIVAGEKPTCHKVGTVQDSVDDISRGLITMSCDMCGLMDNCTHEQKRAVGEARIELLTPRGNPNAKIIMP